MARAKDTKADARCAIIQIIPAEGWWAEFHYEKGAQRGDVTSRLLVSRERKTAAVEASRLLGNWYDRGRGRANRFCGSGERVLQIRALDVNGSFSK